MQYWIVTDTVERQADRQQNSSIKSTDKYVTKRSISAGEMYSTIMTV